MVPLTYGRTANALHYNDLLAAILLPPLKPLSHLIAAPFSAPYLLKNRLL
ncbi:hypothetical protein [uncultured Vibrio sp.]|nr:hypothetical protein [uncultured Vibrio sp.]